MYRVCVWAGGAGLCAYRVSHAGVSSADEWSQERVTLLAAADDTPAATAAVFAYCDPGKIHVSTH